jgi:thiamine kinase-like enzyme
METERSKDSHRAEVRAFLEKHLANITWKIRLPPHGTGQESYFASAGDRAYFIKLGANRERYLGMAKLGLSPKIVTTGSLEDGTTILVQQQITGRKPTRQDFQQHWRAFAQSLRTTHCSKALKKILPERSSMQYSRVGLEVLEEIARRWERYKGKVPAFREYVDQKIQTLRDQVSQFDGSGLVASHNDVCNGNWLVSSDGRIFLLDYESMSLDDPALDLGAILWWYYPPEMRGDFLRAAGCPDEDTFRQRMQIRMAIHNLNIILPREKSFDRFRAEGFGEALTDFRAVVEGKENPQGY